MNAGAARPHFRVHGRPYAPVCVMYGLQHAPRSEQKPTDLRRIACLVTVRKPVRVYAARGLEQKL